MISQSVLLKSVSFLLQQNQCRGKLVALATERWQRKGGVVPKYGGNYFHSTAVHRAKLFVDRENKFAHNVLEQSLKPYQIFHLKVETNNVAPLPEQLPAMVLDATDERTENIDTNEVYDNFLALTHYCIQTNTLLSEQRFRHFIQLFCENTQKLSDEQLLETLRQIALLPAEESVKSPNFMELWNALDMECCRRLITWKVDTLLLVCDAWYTLNLARISQFVTEAIRRIGRRVSRMRPEQLVHAMFFCNVVRRPVYDMFDFEVNLARCVNEMTLQELAVMSMGFFKTQTPIRNQELLEQLYRRLMAEIDTVEDIPLVAILKVLRYSSRLAQVNIMIELLDKLYDQIERLSLLSCLHVALLGCELQSCHDRIIECILQRFSRDIDQSRLKDLERICLVIGVFNIRSASGIENELCQKILALLPSKMDDILRYPRCFINCLHFLTLKGCYSAEMISSVLDTRYVKHTYGKTLALGREIFHLDSFARINLKDSGYEGHLLEERYRRTMGKLFANYMPERNPKYKLNTTDRILMEIKETAECILRYSNFKHVLPHFQRPDIVICYDRKGRKALPLSVSCPADYSGAILTRQLLLGELESPNIETVVIAVAGWNNVVRDKDRYTGLFDLKLKQLQLLGHKPIVIKWHEWREQETLTDRQNFLKRKLATLKL